MAGGEGTRLRPLTNILPKPLIPLNNKTVIESIIEHFTNFNINKFIISINYKSDLIKSFFKELQPSYKFKFIQEKTFRYCRFVRLYRSCTKKIIL